MLGTGWEGCGVAHKCPHQRPVLRLGPQCGARVGPWLLPLVSLFGHGDQFALPHVSVLKCCFTTGPRWQNLIRAFLGQSFPLEVTCPGHLLKSWKEKQSLRKNHRESLLKRKDGPGLADLQTAKILQGRRPTTVQAQGRDRVPLTVRAESVTTKITGTTVA